MSGYWKVQLLNDWVHEAYSGNVQFIRESYGLQWLNRVKPHHWRHLTDGSEPKLKIGVRIEICNALREWVQVNSACEPLRFTSTVITFKTAKTWTVEISQTRE